MEAIKTENLTKYYGKSRGDFLFWHEGKGHLEIICRLAQKELCSRKQISL